MKRINYLLSSSERYTGVTLPPALAPELRAPVVVLACSLALVVVLWAVQHARIAAAERDGAEYARRLAATEISIARVRAVEKDVVTLRALDERIREIRRSGPARASEIAMLGNRLPADAWLTAVRADRTALAVEGHGARLSAVGRTIASLAALPPYAGARLISVHEDPVRRGVAYALALEPRR